MRTNVIFIAFALLFGVVACEKDKSLPIDQVPIKAVEFLANKYPTASESRWELVYNQYNVTFNFEDKSNTAKFTYSGDWLITQTPLSYSDIPRPVIDSLLISNFRNWVIRDQNKEDTQKNGPLYRLLMYDDARERPLYYTAEGKLVIKSL